MTSFSSLRARLVGTVFLAIAPGWAVLYLLARKTGTHEDLQYTLLAGGIGLLALGAAWFGGERFVLRQVRVLSRAAKQLAAGNLSIRTGLAKERGELGELAGRFDRMAEVLEERVKEREEAEKTLLHRSFQQTVVSALGQFALVSNDFFALLNQAVMLVAQTLEVEYSGILQVEPDGQLLLRAGVGWKDGAVGALRMPVEPRTPFGKALTSGEPVVLGDPTAERPLSNSSLLVQHGVVSGMTVAIVAQGQTFGVLGAYSTHERRFTEDEIHFLLATSTVLAMAVARTSLEAQLRQSQKMESVGQLAAGVAHDFNNMLTIIQGHAGMLIAKAARNSPEQESAQAICFAAERAANLTRQLLMFSRKNVMQPRMLDLREVVLQMSKMLQRLLGETIVLEFAPPAEIPLIEADIGMVEQVVMNLAVNARDAMPRGGRLTISTEAVEIGPAYLQAHPEARAGAFACLRVADTGCGMDQMTMGRIFEPFFTTKEVGKGTGLGLATVYGIVKQHRGWIEVASDLSKGTAFSIFFPAGTEPVRRSGEMAAPATQVRGGKETILVVEDEPVLREMALTILRECGYQVLEAGSGPEALKVWAKRQAEIDLVVTDVVMPEGISGTDLAGRLLALKPSLKVVLASGYSMEDLDTVFLRRGHAIYLQKPYTHVTLAKAVRDCLDK